MLEDEEPGVDEDVVVLEETELEINALETVELLLELGRLLDELVIAELFKALFEELLNEVFCDELLDDELLLPGLYSIGNSGFPWSEFFCVSSQL